MSFLLPHIRNRLQPLRNERGVTLMLVLVLIVILGLSAGMAGTTWKTIMQQEREAELLFRGDQIRRAIEGYFTHGHGQQPQQQRGPGRVGAGPGGGTYPQKLEDLLRDPRSVGATRHLRKLYKDPMTGEDWVLIKDPSGRIKGVKSASTLKPFKEDGFAKEYESFKGKTSYADWQFVFEPGQSGSTNTTGGTTIKELPGMSANQPTN
jgi:type II secretory pathway pseudopilin PulG